MRPGGRRAARTLAGRRAAAWLVLGLASAGPACAAPPCPAVPPLAARHYAGRVASYVADLKTSFPESDRFSPETALTASNYRAVLDGLVNAAGVNGVRLPIVPAFAGAADYPPLYRDVLAYARSLGVLVYAGPLAVGTRPFEGWSDDRYAAWLADYADAFRPDVLSPFNEAGIDDSRMAAIVRSLRGRVAAPVLLMGPDRQHVAASVRSLERDRGFAALFDIVGSHNADRDAGATAAEWAALVAAAGGRPAWSSENPALWGRGQIAGLPGMDQAVEGGVSGVVSWMAKPGLVDGEGRPTPKACGIAAGLVR